jgi:CHAD domain-containing protein
VKRLAAPAELLSRPPEEGARLLALSYLDEAVAARPRLDDADDSEALHDFRVALRRLRSCLKSYDAELAGSVQRKLAKRLRRLARVTGPGRDTEVQIAWLRSRSPVLSSYQRAGYHWLVAHLEERMGDAYHDLAKELARDFGALEGDLRRGLSVYRAEVHLDGAARPTFAGATAEILHRQAAKLARQLAAVRGADDVERAHRARIGAKRLRYLLDPLAQGSPELPGAARVVKRLKGLQELLGELHDAHVLEAELEEALGLAAALRARKLLELSLSAAPDEALLRTERRRPREAGLLALARLNRTRRDGLYGKLAAQWLDDLATGHDGGAPAAGGEESPPAAPSAQALDE